MSCKCCVAAVCAAQFEPQFESALAPVRVFRSMKQLLHRKPLLEHLWAKCSRPFPADSTWLIHGSSRKLLLLNPGKCCLAHVIPKLHRSSTLVSKELSMWPSFVVWNSYCLIRVAQCGWWTTQTNLHAITYCRRERKRQKRKNGKTDSCEKFNLSKYRQ